MESRRVGENVRDKFLAWTVLYFGKDWDSPVSLVTVSNEFRIPGDYK